MRFHEGDTVIYEDEGYQVDCVFEGSRQYAPHVDISRVVISDGRYVHAERLEVHPNRLDCEAHF